MTKGLLTVKEASDYSNKSVHTIRKLIKEKKIKVEKQTIKNTDRVFIKKESLDLYYGIGDDTTKVIPSDDYQQSTNHNLEINTNDKLYESRIADLKERIQSLEGELSNKNQQIDNLIKSREHADIMLNDAQKQIFLLQSGRVEDSEGNVIEETLKEEEKKGFFSRLFNK